MAWSSAPRLSGLEIVSRTTWGAGSSTSRRPEGGRGSVSRGRGSVSLLEDNERVALGDRLTLAAPDLAHDAGILGLHRHLHLHRLQDDDRIALLDGVADLDLDLPDGARDVGLDVGHVRSPPVLPCGGWAAPAQDR